MTFQSDTEGKATSFACNTLSSKFWIVKISVAAQSEDGGGKSFRMRRPYPRAAANECNCEKRDYCFFCATSISGLKASAETPRVPPENPSM